MSLESTIGDLVTKTTLLLDYFNTKKAGIDSAVAAAIAAVPATKRTFFVNQLTGLDTNDGSAAAPLKSIDKALSNTPVGGVCIASLQADYVMSVNIGNDGRQLTLQSDVAGIKRKVTANYYPASDGTSTYLSGFSMVNGGAMMAADIQFVMPTSVGVSPAPIGFVNALFKSTSNGGSIVLSLKLSACEIQAAAEGGYIIGAPNSAVIFESMGTSFPSGFGGRYISGVASGTAPATLSNVMTNLSSL